jgi:hypothetical protein
MSGITEESIILVISKSNDDDSDAEEDSGEYAKFGRPLSNYNVKICLKNTTTNGQKNKQVGGITGVSVNRQAIGYNGFFEAFDEYSSELEWVGCSLLENKRGRTRLNSLRAAGDDPEFDFFLIESFWIDQDLEDPCVVATFALRKFIYSDVIKGNYSYGTWGVSSIAYALHDFGFSEEDQQDQTFSGTSGKRKRCDGEGCYDEAIPFLRNEFFQDTALLQENPDNCLILVGGVEHFQQSLKSESAVMPALRALRSRLAGRKATGKDAEILSRVELLVDENDQLVQMESLANVSRAMLGNAIYQPPTDKTTAQQLQSLRRDLDNLVREGGSIARSTALHAACEKNSIKVVKLLLEVDPQSVSVKDCLGRTPLMIAAINACGRKSINGINETEVMDHLLSAGARKNDVDNVGLTAYGHLKKRLFINSVHLQYRATLTDLEHKLYPPGGPTTMDFSKGSGGTSGLVDYGPEDEEERRLWGGGDDDGDY